VGGRRGDPASVGPVSADRPLHERVVSQGEETLGKLAQDLLESSVVNGALSAAFETRERAMRAQELALSALNLPSASDLERLTRRLRNVSQRLEAIEDGLDRVQQRVEGIGERETATDLSTTEARLRAVEETLARIEAAVGTSTAAE
jgi:predicted  nucleic acid-binding Zn-ribbon protein